MSLLDWLWRVLFPVDLRPNERNTDEALLRRDEGGMDWPTEDDD